VARRIADPVVFGPALVLDAQALSLLADEDEVMVAILDEARADRHAATLSTVTLAEQRRSGKAGQRLRWLRSRMTVIPVTEQIADLAAGLLESTGLVGHQCTVDALVVATAAAASGPAKVASCDGSHMPALCKAASHGRRAPVTWVRL
jgi:predicted nucleic acid-binding protein